jgi:DNA-binding NarL/FixJ family response regulator
MRVVIADDQRRAAQGLEALLEAWPEVEVVGKAANGQEAVQLVRKYGPDVVLMDIRMPVMDGLEATRLIKSQLPQVRIVALTMDVTCRAAALAAGADAFLVKGGPPEDLRAVIGAERRTASASAEAR